MADLSDVDRVALLEALAVTAELTSTDLSEGAARVNENEPRRILRGFFFAQYSRCVEMNEAREWTCSRASFRRDLIRVFARSDTGVLVTSSVPSLRGYRWVRRWFRMERALLPRWVDPELSSFP